MGSKKMIPQQLFAVAKKRVENRPTKSREPVVNHWAILDEIEAPMWVDLTLECDSTYEDKDDDEWFHISHPFHQCSARQIISTPSFTAEHCMNSSSIDVPGPASPKLPPSVSKSRGKDYKSKKQEPLVCRSTLSKQLLFKSRSSKSSSINTGSLNVNDHLNHVSDPKHFFSKSVPSFEGEGSNSNGSITSEATAGKLIEASTQSFGLLSNIRDSLRKSYVTRQASRVEIKTTRQVDGQKSSSSKSSVGSSSNPTCDGMNKLVKRNMEKTPDSIKNIKKLPQLPSDKVDRGKSYLGMNREASKTMDRKKPKEGYVTRKAIPQAKANNSTRARGINNSRTTINIGKENQSGKISLPVKSCTVMKEAECPLQDPKVVRRKIRQTSDRTKLTGPKDNGSSPSIVKKSSRMVETVYFR